MPVYKRPRKVPVRGRKRRTTPRATMRMTRRVMPRDKIVTKRRFHFGTLSVVPSAWTATSYGFKLNDLQNSSEFTALFQSYRVAGVKFTCIPTFTGNDQAQTLENNFVTATYYTQPRVYYLIDRDGVGDKSTENEFLQHPNVKIIRNPYKTFEIYCRNPMFRVPTEGIGGLSVAPSLLKTGFLDTSSPGVPHFGITLAGQAAFGSSGTNLTYNIVATYYIVCKGVK